MRRHITFVLGSLLLVGLAGCSVAADPGVATAGGDKATSGSATPVSDKEAGLKFAQCMRENGLPDFPDPKFDDNGELELNLPVGTDPKSVAVLQEKCKKYLPNGGAPEKMNPEDLKKIQAYAKCMRDNGMPKFPDPDSAGDLSDKGLDPASSEFKAADEKCGQLMPGGGSVGLSPGGGQ
jgi:hypothetical protein